MSNDKPPISFRANAILALKDKALRGSMRNATDTFVTKRTESVAQVPIEEWRDKASAIRMHVLDNLPHFVDLFSKSATAAGSVVYRAKDAEAARDIVSQILKDRGAKKVVKSKSMVTEEIHLNAHLEKQGVEVVETDLGEYIVQIASESPSHILAPAIHKNRQQIGRLFAEKLGVEYSEDPETLTKIARRALRQEFIDADAGITGANFALADTGSLVLFTNEGNGRMVTTLPKLNIAVLSIEKMLPSIADLSTLIRLLPRSATGQILSSYVSIVTGVRKKDENTGPKEQHIVLVDNGRTEIVSGEYREILKCIRCSACMNVCPVYRIIGGHAYDSTYPGPMGIILTSLLDGMDRAHPLLDATTLCGACAQVCPVRVPLVELLSKLREERVRRGFTESFERSAMAAYGVAVGSSSLFSLGQKSSRLGWPFGKLFDRNGTLKRLPKPVKVSFKRRMS